MSSHLWEHINNNHTNYNQGNPDNSRQIWNLLECYHSNHRYKNNTYSGPDGVGNSYGDVAKGKTQKIKCTGITNNCHYWWPEFRKFLRLFQKSRGNNLKYNCQCKKNITASHKFILSAKVVKAPGEFKKRILSHHSIPGIRNVLLSSSFETSIIFISFLFSNPFILIVWILLPQNNRSADNFIFISGIK